MYNRIDDYRRFNRKSIEVSVAPAASYVALADLKSWLAIDDTSQDTLLTQLINAAERMAEKYTKRSFINRTLIQRQDGFDGVDLEGQLLGGTYTLPRGYAYNQSIIQLSSPPLVSVTQVVTYGTDNTSSVFDNTQYEVDLEGGRIYLDEGSAWPSNLRDENAVEVTYVAGYGTNASDVPEEVVTATTIIAGFLYDCPSGCSDGGIPQSAQTLLDCVKLHDYLVG